MGIRCSVFGHDYGETDVEREHDERGEEVVRTARRVQRCHNCGHERTVSANTEITALEPGDGVVREPDGTVVAATAAANAAGDRADGITIEETETAGVTPVERTTDGPTDGGAATLAADGTGADDAAVTDSTDTADGTGADDAAVTDSTDTADGTGVDDARVNDDPTDAAEADVEEPIPTVEGSDTDEPADEPDRAPGEWPPEPGDESAASGTRSPGSASLTPLEPPTNEPADDAVDTEANGSSGVVRSDETFACSACGFTAAVADSPLRAGDICPDCRTGYLARGTRKG